MANLFGKKIFGQRKKKEIPGGLWDKCPHCNEMLHGQNLRECLFVCPYCEHHMPLPRQSRIQSLIDLDTWDEWSSNLTSTDALGFTGKASYISKLKENQKKAGYDDAITTGRGRMGHHDVALGVMDFQFLGASMGSVVGEKITRLIEGATHNRIPVVLICASGGARMYEGLYSLMQMSKTSAALARHADAGLPFIPVLTHPTMAGVMASFASLGDVILAEPKALIGFAGARVIKETTQQDLPPGFQRSEFLLEHGFIDKIVHRKDLKNVLVDFLDFFGCEPVTEVKHVRFGNPEDENKDQHAEEEAPKEEKGN